ncbi:MAG: ubiquitin-like domain-containing protein [Propionibacteriaceae bacterium]|jgi:uncharacterized protein YabE (DUF348 family)|nr:ubiquitin-like domain-containing protein [Propionibacteriaceae bacterium]
MPQPLTEDRSLRKFVALAVASLLAGLTLLTAGVNLAFAQTVTLSIDGQERPVSVVHASVAEVLAQQNIPLGARDQVSPDLASTARADSPIIVRHARPIALDLDGRQGLYWTTATSVAAVVAELGLDDRQVILSHDPETPIGLDGLSLSIDTGKDVTVTADGQNFALHSPGRVADALEAAGLSYDEDDIITPEPTTWLNQGLAISLVRVEITTVEREVEIPFETTETPDESLYQGRTTVDQAGQAGLRHETVVQTTHDGQLVDEQITATTIVSQPVAQVQRLGAKPLPVVVNSEVKQIAYNLVLERGWDDSQFNCLDNLYQRESGWNPYAANPSGAYGIPQALPGSKMASAGADWQTNPRTQIIWGLGYIVGRYSTPCGAWSHFQSSGWY